MAIDRPPVCESAWFLIQDERFSKKSITFNNQYQTLINLIGSHFILNSFHFFVQRAGTLKIKGSQLKCTLYIDL